MISTWHVFLVAICVVGACGTAQAGGRSSPSLRISDIALVGDEIQLVAQASTHTRGLAIFGGPTNRVSNVHDYFVRYRLPKEAGKPPQWIETHEILSAHGKPFGDRRRQAFRQRRQNPAGGLHQ